MLRFMTRVCIGGEAFAVCGIYLKNLICIYYEGIKIRE
jgi:hypothetical protein